MARVILFTFSLCLLLSAGFSLPIANQGDKKLVQYSNSARENKMERTQELDVVTVLSPRKDSERDTKPVKSLYNEMSVDSVVGPTFDGNIAKRFNKRNKRQVIQDHQCPYDMVRYGNLCLTLETMKRVLEEDEEYTYD